MQLRKLFLLRVAQLHEVLDEIRVLRAEYYKDHD